MPLIRCQDCGGEVSTSAKVCPHCGAECTGNFYLWRKPKWTGCMYSVTVELDGEVVSKLNNDQSVRLTLAEGHHTLKLSGGFLSRTVDVSVASGRFLLFFTEFSNLGVLGGGLRLEQIHW